MTHLDSISLKVPAQLRFRDVVLRTCAAACELAAPGRRRLGASGRMDLGDPFAAGLVSALSEIFNNVVEYGHAGEESAFIYIFIEVARGQLTVRSVDYGERFDLERVPPPRLDALPEHGLGVFIARSLVDELEYHPGPPNQWVLKKKHRSPEGPCSSAS